MKVVVPALHWFPDVPGGAARLARGHARALAARGHDVWLLAPAATPGAPEREDVEGLHVLRYVPVPYGPFDPRRRSAHRNAARALLRHHVGTHADAVHGHALLPLEAALELYGDRAVTSCSLHSPVRHEFRASARGESPLSRLRLEVSARLLHRIEARVLRGVRFLTAESAFTQRLVAESHGTDVADRMQVVPGWVDGGAFGGAEPRAARAALGVEDAGPLFLTIRRLVPRMGLDRLLAACGRLARRGATFRLVIGGEGPLRADLEARALAEGVSDRVRFVGRIPEVRLSLWYSAADAFVLPTAELECFGLIALEAMASGRPCLATPAGAIPEVVAAIEPAWLARGTDVAALEELLAAFLAGALPTREPAALRAAILDEWGAERVLPRLLAATGAREAA